MFLDTTSKSLEIVLGTVVTTNQLPITVDYVDMTTTTTLAGSNDTQSNGVTAVTILAAPAVSTQRKVNGITIYNADMVSKVVTVRLNNNSTLRPLVVSTLQVGDTLGYTDTQGWYVLDTNGNLKATNTISGLATITGGSIDNTPIGATTPNVGHFTIVGVNTASQSGNFELYKTGYGSTSIGATFRDSTIATYAANADNLVTIRGTGTSAVVWRGRITAGGDNNAFLMGEYNSQAWLGAHNAGLSAWADLHISPDGNNQVTYIGTIGGIVGGPAIVVQNSNGFVGINKTPTTALDVNGVSTLSNSLDSSGVWNNPSVVLGVTSGTNQGISFGLSNAGGYTWQSNIKQGTGPTQHRFYSYTTEAFRYDTTGLVTFQAGITVIGAIAGTTIIKTGGYTVATLPAGTVGMRAYVTDATAPTFLGALTGGGTVTTPVFYNGTAWVAG